MGGAAISRRATPVFRRAAPRTHPTIATVAPVTTSIMATAQSARGVP
jgi:hypothetical protein